MTSRTERATGLRADGSMTIKRFAEHVEAAHGTIKRWIHEGMPVSRDGHHVWIDPKLAKEWIAARFAKRGTVAIRRSASVYFAQREDGVIKIGWSSDVVRRIFELRKETKMGVELLAVFPAAKPDELRLHERFAAHRIEGEWYEPASEILSTIESLRGAAA